jgi:hypothetical protein
MGCRARSLSESSVAVALRKPETQSTSLSSWDAELERLKKSHDVFTSGQPMLWATYAPAVLDYATIQSKLVETVHTEFEPCVPKREVVTTPDPKVAYQSESPNFATLLQNELHPVFLHSHLGLAFQPTNAF